MLNPHSTCTVATSIEYSIIIKYFLQDFTLTEVTLGSTERFSLSSHSLSRDSLLESSHC